MYRSVRHIIRAVDYNIRQSVSSIVFCWLLGRDLPSITHGVFVNKKSSEAGDWVQQSLYDLAVEVQC